MTVLKGGWRGHNRVPLLDTMLLSVAKVVRERTPTCLIHPRERSVATHLVIRSLLFGTVLL